MDELGEGECVLGVDVLGEDGVVGARGLKCETFSLLVCKFLFLKMLQDRIDF